MFIDIQYKYIQKLYTIQINTNMSIIEYVFIEKFAIVSNISKLNKINNCGRLP